MSMPFDYSHNTHPVRPLREVQPIIDAHNPMDAIGQIFDFMRRHQDFRVGVPDTSYFPFSAICKLLLTFPSGQYGGTGFYIGPGLILTCGHNLFDQVPGATATEVATAVTIRPGQQNETTFLDSFNVTPADWTVHPLWVSSGATDRAHDLSVIRVSNAPPNNEYFRLINYSPVPETPLAVCGYGGRDVDSDRQHLDIDRIRRLSEGGEVLEYNLQTRRGNSGSPVFVDFTNAVPGGDAPSSIPVMGVHVASGDTQHNRGVLLTPDKIAWAQGGGIMSVAHSLSSARGNLGGLPLVSRSRAALGGLPLGRATPRAPVAAQSWARPMTRNWIVIDTNNGMSIARRTFGHPSHDLSGKTTLSVRVPNMPDGGSVRWNIPDAGDRTRVLFENGSSTSASAGGTSVTLRALDGGVAHVDCMVKDASGTTVESNKYIVSSPRFVFVAIDPPVDAFFDTLGLGARRADIYAEIQAVARDLYSDINIRFVFPGQTLPAHLGVASDPAFPGGVEVLPSVYYALITADPDIVDPENSTAGAMRTYPAGFQGRHHEPGQAFAPLDHHSIGVALLHRMRLIPEVGAVEDALTSSTLTAANQALAATMYGRILGEVMSHEVGHYPHQSFTVHASGGLMQDGAGRTFTEMTGMTPGTGAAILTDGGRGTINRLSAGNRRTFENSLPVRPPLDAAEETTRGRVGSFSHTSQAPGWPNRATARPMTGETVHLPGATVLDGWQAQAFIYAIETAARAAFSANPATMMLSYLVSVDTILDACDRYDVTIGVGPSLGAGLGAGGSGGYGMVFAPGRRIGFYATYSGIVGWIYSIGLIAQVTVVRGGPENFGGESRLIGGSVDTVGWFDTGVLGVPIGMHRITNAAGQELGYTFEVGVGAGLPIISLIEAYGQAAETATTFGRQPRGWSMTAAPADTEARQAALNHAVASGASPGEAQAFVDALFS